MAVYKVPQDVEAEDKLIGPFSFRQFVFIIIMVAFIYLCYVMFRINPLAVILPLPVAVFFGILGLWPRKDQPVEVYLGALIRFWTKPHNRIWSQEGQARHVEVTAPPKEEHKYSDEMSQTEVRSRLSVLAQTMDTRGWAVKNVEVQDVTANQQNVIEQSDRLVMPQQAVNPQKEVIDIHKSDDILDVNNNPVAQNFDQLSQKAADTAKAAAIENMQHTEYNPTPPEDQVNYNPYPEMRQRTIKTSAELEKEATAQPPQAQQAQATSTDEKESTSTTENTPSTAILNLANNSDLSVSTIARAAEEAEKSLHDDETIELH